MSWNVHLHIAFSAYENDPIAAVAKKHLALVEQNDDIVKEVKWFLKDASKRTGRNPGPKGGLFLWGKICNFLNAEAFIKGLSPFFLEILSTKECDPGDWERIVIFYEPEQSEAAHAYEVSLDETRLAIRHFQNLPFTWMQF